MDQYLQMVDVWIKGEEQKNMRPNDWPGETVFVGRTPEISTTSIIEKLHGEQV